MYKGDNYKKKFHEISNAWNQRINDNILVLSQENTRPIEEHLQVIPSELEIVKQDFKKWSSELGKKIEKLEEEKIQLGLDADVQKLKIDYKKLRLSMRTAVLGKTSEQWH
ncbi:hypothetical protein Gotri_019435 [Gossypium trilobum]|uniref:Uncharacterized protein n=1 Tax=Gossypium trilobum TaxID=34281 RepID=A0A7J9ECY6_9ROSI|nr:hypothetical protein [Gossypium trilobum]